MGYALDVNTLFERELQQRTLSAALIFVGVLLAGLSLSPSAYAAACQEPQLEKVSSADIRCRFYKGTRHYRSEDYASAGKEWQAIVDAPPTPKDDAYLRASAQSNLGYLYFMGLGVKQDRERAIHAYWLPAHKAGHDEAGYHLCHAYADERPAWALGYCREALQRYSKAGAAERGDQIVVDQLKNYIRRLEGE